MLEKAVLEVRDISSQVEGERYQVRIKVYNPEARTIHAYGSMRAVRYDNNSHALVLLLHDQYLEDDDSISRDIPQPVIVQLESKAESEIMLSLAPVIKRFRSASERQGGGALTEELRIYEAEEASVEIAHQDTPFYFNPKDNNVRQFKEWGAAITKATIKLTEPKKRRPAK